MEDVLVTHVNSTNNKSDYTTNIYYVAYIRMQNLPDKLKYE